MTANHSDKTGQNNKKSRLLSANDENSKFRFHFCLESLRIAFQTNVFLVYFFDILLHQKQKKT